jgi:hypothetical protein
MTLLHTPRSPAIMTQSFWHHPHAEADERHNLLTEDAQNLMVSDARRGGAQALSQH